MNFILFDDKMRVRLLPLVFTRPVSDLRCGILTLREKWEYYVQAQTSTLTVPYLQQKFPLKPEKSNTLINGSVLPSPLLLDEISKLEPGSALYSEDFLIAVILSDTEIASLNSLDEDKLSSKQKAISRCKVQKIRNLWDVFSFNGEQIEHDYNILSTQDAGMEVPDNVIVSGNRLFIGKGATVRNCSINTEFGPVFIGNNAEIMEGCSIRGPFALCDNAVLKMGTVIYGPTTIGPGSKAGGEISNSILQANSNKAHHGFLGNSVIGEWCNLGAGTTNSNLKNNYSNIRVWSYETNTYEDSGLQFCGIFMGDHAKSSINSMFNSGTVIGVSSNVFGSGFPSKFIPSFRWGGYDGFEPYRLEDAMQTAGLVLKRRGMVFDDVEESVLKSVYDIEKKPV
jgi:UDP-N-acetylglucosamine diphosphorylase/glucosamine-1-phosphate N-acetyltransferase